MDKRYQVFVSSTYVDLKEERRQVIQRIIEMDCIPAGMELFPAADEEQFQFIKRVIDDCDYYLLIIGGRYGSVASDGTSYTEKEFDYAVSRGLRVIALVHENPDEIPLGKSEKDQLLREKLKIFTQKAATDRLVKYWKSADELSALVVLSLASTIKMFPAVGWVRANKAASEDLLLEINNLRKQNSELRAASAELRQPIANLAGLSEKVTLHGNYKARPLSLPYPWRIDLTWAQIFALIAPYLVSHPTDEYVKSTLATNAFVMSNSTGQGEPVLDDQLFRTIALQMQALGFVKVEYLQSMSGGMFLYWSLTPQGERQMMELRTVKSVKTSVEGGQNAGTR